MTRSRCGADTLCTPLSQSRATLHPASTRATTTPFPILPTYLGKSSRSGKSYQNRWQRTDRSPQVTNFVLATMIEERSSSIFPSVTTVTRLHILYRPFLLFCCAIYIEWVHHIVFIWFFFKFTTTPPLNRERPPHREEKFEDT
jgi:hypothetical protein